MILTIQHWEVFWEKAFTILDNELTPFGEFTVAETIVWW